MCGRQNGETPRNTNCAVVRVLGYMLGFGEETDLILRFDMTSLSTLRDSRESAIMSVPYIGTR